MNCLTKSLTIVLLPCLAMVLAAVDAAAQEKQQVSSRLQLRTRNTRSNI